MVTPRGTIAKLPFLLRAFMCTLSISLLTSQIAFAASDSISLQRTLRIGSGDEDPRRLQARLIELGYSPSPANGVFSWQTYYAVVAFQKVNKLARDGIVGPKTYQSLDNPKTIGARYSGDHVEISKAYQVFLSSKMAGSQK
ncbi:MAG: peptidoglycan-binding protein [Firmicutes bacterium]|nr:peptidoglycan-binding protein [Bacillota bacterium]